LVRKRGTLPRKINLVKLFFGNKMHIVQRVPLSYVIFLLIENLANSSCSSNGPFFFKLRALLLHRKPHALHNLDIPSNHGYVLQRRQGRIQGRGAYVCGPPGPLRHSGVPVQLHSRHLLSPNSPPSWVEAPRTPASSCCAGPSLLCSSAS